MICRKAHVMLPDANFTSPWCQSPSSRAQNRGFCALLGFGTPVFRLFEHKIEVFVRFWGWDPCFQAFRAQNRGFCALLRLETLVFGHFEHKLGVFVRFWGWKPLFSGISSTKSGFLCADYHEMAIGKRQTATGLWLGGGIGE